MHLRFTNQPNSSYITLILTIYLYLNYMQLIQLRKNKYEDSRERMKSAVYVAGLQGKQVVLYVPQNIDRKTLQDVCSVMSEGKFCMLCTKTLDRQCNSDRDVPISTPSRAVARALIGGGGCIFIYSGSS